MPVSAKGTLTKLLDEADGYCRNYECQEAARLYNQALIVCRKDNLPEATHICELLADSQYKGAFQAEDRTDFKQRMKIAETTYNELSVLNEKSASIALANKAKAKALFASYWLADSSKERPEILHQCIRLAEETVIALESHEAIKELADTRKDLLTYLTELQYYLGSWNERRDQFGKMREIAIRAAEELQSLHEDQGRLEILFLTSWLLSVIAFQTLESHQYVELMEEKKKLIVQLRNLAQKIDTPYAHGLAAEASGLLNALGQEDLEAARASIEAAAAAAERTNDTLQKGRIIQDLLPVLTWSALNQDDIELRRNLLETGLELAPKALRYLSVSASKPLIAHVYAWNGELRLDIARWVDTSADDRVRSLREAIRIATEGTAYQPPWQVDPRHPLSKAMYFLAEITSDPKEKTRLLEDALRIREEQIKIEEYQRAPHSWDLGVDYNYLALIKAELADLKQDMPSRVQLLNSAVQDMQRCIEDCTPYAKTPGTSGGLADYEEWYGDIQLKLGLFTKENNNIKKAIKIFESAIVHLAFSKQFGSVAGVRWKIAKALDSIGEYAAAAETFHQAAAEYQDAGKKFPGLTATFQELSSYMQSWSEINQARLQHTAERFAGAAENYQKAAMNLQATKTWNHLAIHYTACSLLEEGETKSREDNQKDSIEVFSKATQSFREAESVIEERIRIAPPDEVQEVRDWAKINAGRVLYSTGRTLLEEARLLDKKGEKTASAAKYHGAAEAFQALLSEVQSQQDPGELRTLSLSCNAWAKMKDAETQASPELYAEAANLFLKAKDATAQEKSRLSSLANASICRALESGTRFRQTQNTELYGEIKKQLVTAAGYYEEAGFQNAADWTHASQRLFDALLYLADAEAEKNPKTKADLYHLVEKHLELAAELYSEAGYTSKQEEALRYLKKARLERKLLLTPVEALTENPAATGTPIAPAALTRDQAIGLERFESANVQGNLILREKEVNIGSSLSVELEIANIGKTAAMLIKLENIVPDGFTFDKESSQLTAEDGYINMKGRRLEYLKTFETKLALRARRKGEHALKPRILFADEKGGFRSFEFEPVAIVVRELGISGWVRGASK